ncbi:MAG: hypothetical protein KAJ19_07845, partial [Gammaproteobacteria bacterium]|nr:hypothetical protein [Gammaproteobacteria bacterium]
MKFDGTIDLATGIGVKSRVWKNKKMQWGGLVEKLSEATKTSETYKEFNAASKEDQGKIKDVGGYVGGYLRNGRRKPENVVYRQLVTLDIDYGHGYFWDDFTMTYGNAAVLHATHSHSEEKPRYRLIIPLSREVAPDEYMAISRYIAGSLGIELFDDTTFQTHRLMFWPSVSKDVDYYFKSQDGTWADADEILASYVDWTDSSLWPVSKRKALKIKEGSEKQEDPETKKGIVGAFCRAYPVKDAIETFLGETYAQTTTEDRYTYIKGTAAAGLIVYDDKFAYSHHGTDPCGGKLCNSFDLVRIHRFGHLESTESSGTKSFKEMEVFARSDKKVKSVIADEKMADIKFDFADPPEEQKDLKWMQGMEVDGRGNYISSSININLILANDSNLKKVFKQNSFDGKKYVFKNLPWRKITKPEPVKNVDYAGIRNYIESVYGISGKLKIEDSLILEFEKQSFHPIKEYLGPLEWDGKPRLDYLLVDAFGAEDNAYTREAI